MLIRVVRGAGDKQGGDITDDLLTTEGVAQEKGKWAINNSTSKKIENGNGPLSEFLDTGKLVQVTTKEGSYRGKLTFFSQTIDIDPDGRNYFPTSSFRVQRILDE